MANRSPSSRSVFLTSLGILLFAANVSAQPTIEVRAVKVNGQPIEPASHLDVNGGDTVEAEIWLRDWSPNGEKLRAYQITVNRADFGGEPCGLQLYGEDYAAYDCACVTDEDCGACPVEGATHCYEPGSYCAGPGYDVESGAFINILHVELVEGEIVNTYVFASGPIEIPMPCFDCEVVEVTETHIRYGQAVLNPEEAVSYPRPGYAASLILQVPLGAGGAFTIGMQRELYPGGPAATLLLDEFGVEITPLQLVPLTVTVDARCDRPDICVVYSYPWPCAIDARQPSNPDGSNAAGWNFVDLTFDGDPSWLTPEDFVVREVPDAPPPKIVSISIRDENTLRLQFNRRITLRTWTCVSAPGPQCPDGNHEICFAHNPADVNGDGAASPPDILHLIDCLNGVRTCELHQCDIDHSGVCGPPDILRVIDILNPPWKDFLPPRRLSICPSAP